MVFFQVRKIKTYLCFRIICVREFTAEFVVQHLADHTFGDLTVAHKSVQTKLQNVQEVTWNLGKITFPIILR